MLFFDIPFLAYLPAGASLSDDAVFSGSAEVPGEILINDEVIPPNPIS